MKALDYMIKEGLYEYSGDTWGDDNRSERYESVERVDGQVNYKDEIFVVSHEDGGGCGMGAYPPSVKIIRIISVVEPTKVVIIESELGWGQKIDDTKEFDTREEAEDFVKEYNKANNKDVIPEIYWYARIDE